MKVKVKNYGNWVSFSSSRGIPGFYEGHGKLLLPVIGGEYSPDLSYRLERAEAGPAKFNYLVEASSSEASEGFIFIVPTGESWQASAGVCLKQASDKNMLFVVPNGGHVDVRGTDGKIRRYTPEDYWVFSSAEYAIRQTLDLIQGMARD